jgi:hypothetical protein
MKTFAFGLIVIAGLSSSAAFAYDSQGSGKISDGKCTCKIKCDQFAKAGQLAGAQQCKSACEQNYAGCNKGARR